MTPVHLEIHLCQSFRKNHCLHKEPLLMIYRGRNLFFKNIIILRTIILVVLLLPLNTLVKI